MIVAAMGIAALFGIAAAVSQPQWPALEPIPSTMITPKRYGLRELAKQQLSPDFSYFVHDPAGAYMHRGAVSPCTTNDNRIMDDDGVPMIPWKGAVHYHPVMAAHCGHLAHAWTLAGNDGKDLVIVNANKLIYMQDERGAFQYPFAWRYYHYKEDFQPGWTSAMAQGQAMSLFSRAYRMTGDKKYLIAGKKALDYLLTPVSAGGVMTTMADIDTSLGNFIFFEEFPTKPANYTLNGYIFSLLGLYDWSQFDAAKDYGQAEARKYFARGIDTLKRILPYYDIGGITAYDLGFLTFKQPTKVKGGYHMLHTFQLHVLYELTKEPIFKRYEEKWLGYAREASAQRPAG